MSLGLELALAHSCIHFLYFLATVVIRSALPQHSELTALKSWSVNLPPFKYYVQVSEHNNIAKHHWDMRIIHSYSGEPESRHMFGVGKLIFLY